MIMLKLPATPENCIACSHQGARIVDVRIREEAEEGLPPAEEDAAGDGAIDGENLDDFFE